MSKKQQNLLFIIVASLLAVYFTYDIFISVYENRAEIYTAIENANLIWLVVSVVLAIIAYWFRAARWNILFEPMGLKIKVKNGFWTIAFAYIMNFLIPRSGEIARATSLAKLEDVPVEKSLGTIMLERVIDMLFLGIFFVLTLVFCPKPYYAFLELANATPKEESSNLLTYIIFSIIFLLGIVSFIFRKRILKSSFFGKVKNFLLGFKEGLLSILKIKHKGLFTVYSIGIWVCYFFMTYLVIYAFDATKTLTIEYGLFLMIAGALGMLLPVSGGLAYPRIMRFAFAAIYISLGKNAEDGDIVGNYFGLSVYLAQVTSVLLFGTISIFYISKNSRK